MQPQKYVFDHFNQSMGSGSNWKQNMLANFLQKKDLYDNKLESVIFRTEMCTHFRSKDDTFKQRYHGIEIEFFKFKTEIYQRIDLKGCMRKMESFVQLYSLPELWSVRCQKWLIYVLSAGYSKESVPVWARYLRPPVRSCFAFSENTMDYVLLMSYHQQNFNVQKHRISVFLC